MTEQVPGVHEPEHRTDPRDMRNYTWILCGGCERIMDGIPLADAKISTDGLMQIREAGWSWNGVSWECDGCSVFFDAHSSWRNFP